MNKSRSCRKNRNYKRRLRFAFFEAAHRTFNAAKNDQLAQRMRFHCAES
jgi:hypothetical protein